MRAYCLRELPSRGNQPRRAGNGTGRRMWRGSSATRNVLPLLASPLFPAMQPDGTGRHPEVRHPSAAVRRGQTIFQRGDDGSSLMAVLRGRVRISSVSGDGKEITLNVISPGEIFGEIALLDGKPRSADATAIEDTLLLVVERRHFLPFLARTRTCYRACSPCCADGCDAPAWRWRKSRCSICRCDWRACC